MARIPEGEIERIKREVDLVGLVEAYGVKLTRRGRDFVGLCKFHNDKKPSLIITPDKNLWHCMGACNAGGSNIDYVMKAERLDFRQAVERLKAREGNGVLGSGKVIKASIAQRPSASIQWDGEDHEILKQVVDYYHAILKQSPDALAYLKKRGLESSEMVTHFKLGFADRTLAQGVPISKNKEGGKIRSRLYRLGLYKENGFEHFRGSIVIPILDEQGCVREMYGRKICDNVRPGTPLHLYLPGPHKGQRALRGVFNIKALEASKEIILCEALIDALTFWCAGYRNVTSSYGTNGFTDDHLEAFKRYGTKRIYIAYDRDEAGENASISLAEQLRGEGIECYRIQFPKGMDANEYGLKMLPVDKSLGLLIRCAVRIGAPQRGGADMPLPLVAGGQRPPADLPLPLVAEEATDPSCHSHLKHGGMTDVTELPATPISVEVKDQEVVIPIGDRRYRVRGLSKNMSYALLKVNLFVAKGDGFYVDTIDLYSAKARAVYIKQAAMELMIEESVIKKDLGQVLLKVEELQDQQIKETLAPKEKRVMLTEAETAAAIDLLKDPNLLDRILSDFDRCGVVGEETNKLVGYLAATSRKLNEPLAVIIQSSSAAGKTALMEAILAFMPKEERVKYSAMTGQSLFYMQETNLAHKILALVEEQGAERAVYALKLLQSEGELTIASTGKDPNTGRLVTHEYRIEGPANILISTAATDIDEEFLNRCLLLSADERREQTRAIHRLQREKHTLEGLLARRDREAILKVHQDAQRLLQPLEVINPYAKQLTFLDDRTRTRRDHNKYLTLIDAIALLHQYQRPIRTREHQGKEVSYIEVTVADIAIANRLASEVLGRTLDELPPQTRRFVGLLHPMVGEACERLKIDRSDYRFSGREVRQYTGWGHTQVKIHLQRLVELEYLIVHRSGRGQSFVYELLYDGEGQEGGRFLMGLIDVGKLNGQYDEKRSGFLEGWSGQNGEWSGSGRPLVGAWSGGGRGAKNGKAVNVDNGFVSLSSESV